MRLLQYMQDKLKENQLMFRDRELIYPSSALSLFSYHSLIYLHGEREVRSFPELRLIGIFGWPYGT